MKKWGGLTLALLVGCATGAAVRDVVMPARAQGNVASYGYRMIRYDDMEALGQRYDAKLKNDGAVERALNELGRQGWRLAQTTVVTNGSPCYYFEARSGQ